MAGRPHGYWLSEVSEGSDWHHVEMANSAKRRRRLWDAYAFPRFCPLPTVRACSAIRKRVSSASNGAQKNDLRWLCSCALAGTIDARGWFAISRVATGTFFWRSRYVVCSATVAAREARAARLSGGQPLLYQALCLLRSRRCRQATIKDIAQELGFTGDDQDSGDAVHAAQLARAARQDPKPSASTRSRSAERTLIASW